jgi:hypothetical protein
MFRIIEEVGQPIVIAGFFEVLLKLAAIIGLYVGDIERGHAYKFPEEVAAVGR